MEVEKEESKDSIQTQLEESLNNFKQLEDGQLVEGKVIDVTSDLVFLDIGYKSEGKISVSEFAGELPKAGDTVTVVLLKKDGRNGPEVSKAKADAKQVWKDVRKAFEEKAPIEGKIEKVVKGGFDVALGGELRAFLPISQSDSQKVEEPESLLGVRGKFYIERLYSDGKANIVVNRRKYLEEAMSSAREAFFEKTQIGDTVKGTVKTFTSFGAFIDLGGFDGLLHINDMSWGHVTRPKDFVKRDQEIELKVIRMDPAEKRINLSLKHFTEDPWIHFEEKYHVNDIVTGKVTKLTDFGAFIELEEGIEGLAHISEFSWTKKVNKASDVLNIGDQVQCAILGYDIQAGRVSLGIKQATENPWNSISEKFPAGTKVSGKVVKITNSGAFIAIDEGIDGFLHAEDISWTKKVKHPGSELKMDQEVDAVVIECDAENRRIRLGIKQLSEDPWKKFAQEYPSGSTLEGEITSITDFGVFVKTPLGIEGLINKSNLSENRETPFEEEVKKYKVGDKIKVFVVEVKKDKVAFSVREFKKKQQHDEVSQYMASSSAESDGAYTLGDALNAQK